MNPNKRRQFEKEQQKNGADEQKERNATAIMIICAGT